MVHIGFDIPFDAETVNRMIPYKGFSRRLKRKILRTLQDYTGKRYLENKIDPNNFHASGFFVEQKGLVSPENAWVNNEMPRLNHNFIYYSADNIKIFPYAVGAGIAAEKAFIPSDKGSRVGYIIESINQDVSKFRQDFIDKSGAIQLLNASITSVANRATDKWGQFSNVPMGKSSPAYERARHCETLASQWTDNLTANKNVSYLLKDHMKSAPSYDAASGTWVKGTDHSIHIPKKRKNLVKLQMVREAVPKRVAKQGIRYLNKILADIEADLRGRGRDTHGLTKAGADLVVSVMKEEDDRNTAIGSLKSHPQYNNLNNYLQAGSYYSRLNERFSPQLLQKNNGSAPKTGDLGDIVSFYHKVKDEAESRKEFYLRKPARKKVGERVDLFIETAIGRDNDHDIVKNTYDAVRGGMTADTSYLVDRLMDTNSDSRARKVIRQLINDKYGAVLKTMDPDRAQKLKKPFTRMDTMVCAFYKEADKPEVKAEVKNYINLVKMEDFIRELAPQTLIERLKCGLQNIFYRRARKQDAYPELCHL